MKLVKYAVFAIVAIFYCACAEVSTKSVLEDINFKPKISINSVKLKSITLDSITLESNVQIDNFLPISVSIKDAMINIYYEDKIINSYKINDESTLKSRSKSRISLDSTIRINDLVKLIKDYANRDFLPFKIEVATTILIPNAKIGDTELFEYNLREKFDMEIPTINPKISLKKLDFGLNGIEVIMNVKNSTKATFSLENISYDLNLSGFNFSGDAKSVEQSDKSIDIIMNNPSFSLPSNLSKDVSVNIGANLKVDKLDYAIPLNLKKDF